MSRRGRPKGTRTKVPQVIAISKFRRVGVIVSEENLPVDVVEICRKFGNLDRIIAIGDGTVNWNDNWLSFAGSSSRMAVMQLINLGITQVLVKLLVNLQHADTISSEVLTQEVLWLLGQVIYIVVPFTVSFDFFQFCKWNLQIAQRDQKFVSKIKMLNAIKLFHTLLKQHHNNSKTLLPLLLTVKCLARNCE